MTDRQPQDRLRRRKRFAGTAFMAAVLVAAASFAAATDAVGSRIVAIGDIHGDADAFVAVLRRAQLIDESNQWIGGTATLVQTGDVLDRGPKSRAALDLLMALDQQAPRSGGRVLALLGNHEMMNLIGDLHDTPPETYASFADDKSEERRAQAYDAYVKLCRAQANGNGPTPEIYRIPERDRWMAAHPPGFLEYREAIGPEGSYGKWLRTRPTIVKVGETLFLHGGLSPDARQKPEAVSKEIQREIHAFDEYRKYFIDQHLALPWFTLPEILQVVQVEAARIAVHGSDGNGDGVTIRDDTDPRLFAVLRGLAESRHWAGIEPDGPLWFRGYAMWKSEEGAREIGPILDRFDATHIVVGHTIPSTMRITRRFGARVILIDTGMLTSHYPGGRPSALEIKDGQFRAIYLDETVLLLQSGALTVPEIEDIP
jgi:hypothetical protein